MDMQLNHYLARRNKDDKIIIFDDDGGTLFDGIVADFIPLSNKVYVRKVQKLGDILRIDLKY